jgi:hypothetical protein
MTPRLLDPAAVYELQAILCLDAWFTLAVLGALIALDAMSVLDVGEAMDALAASSARRGMRPQ